jgi:hypothetical protein
VGAPLEKRSLGRQKKGQEANVKMIFKERGCNGGRWMELIQDYNQLCALALKMLKFRILLPEN